MRFLPVTLNSLLVELTDLDETLALLEGEGFPVRAGWGIESDG